MTDASRIIYTYCCPRAGGTWLMNLLSVGVGYYVRKIPELDAMHPCQTHQGVVSLMSFLAPAPRHPDIVVRIKRHPVDVAESWVALRDPRLNGGPMSIAGRSDSDIVHYIRTESANAAKIRDAVDKGGWRERFIEVRYEDFDKAAAFERFQDALCDVLPAKAVNRTLWQQYHAETWRKQPVRAGKLSMGWHTVLTADECKIWRSKLADVIALEGYD